VARSTLQLFVNRVHRHTLLVFRKLAHVDLVFLLAVREDAPEHQKDFVFAKIIPVVDHFGFLALGDLLELEVAHDPEFVEGEIIERPEIPVDAVAVGLHLDSSLDVHTPIVVVATGGMFP